jgi:kynurenine formamidase
MNKLMKIIDLTHPISPNMPAYPGTEPPVYREECSIEEVGFLEKKITLYSHTGTHVDAPAHLIKGTKTLDQFPIDHFFGKALLLHLDNLRTQTIGIRALEPHEKTFAQVEFVLIHTAWSRFWGTDRYFSDYPVLSLEAADWLSGFHFKGVGLDTISADKADSQGFPAHKAFLQHDTIIIENITNLGKISCDEFVFSCFPLSFEDADGSPVRAVAFME